MIKRVLRYALIIFVALAIMSCNSMDSDAKKAASLINKSIEQSEDLKFGKAEKTYLKAQKIINKYVEKGKAIEFYERFANYRDKEKKENAK